MIKALIICYDFPPLYSIGAQRPNSFFKHLKKFGIEPIIVTRKWREKITSVEHHYQPDEAGVERIESSEGIIYKVPYLLEDFIQKDKIIFKHGFTKFTFYRRLLSFLQLLFRFSIKAFDDKQFLYRQADEIIKKEKIDIILATGEPFILFKYAYVLSQRHNIPYVLDYRDGWFTNHMKSFKGISNKLIFGIEKYYEKKYLKHCLFFNAVSVEIVNKINACFNINKGVEVQNGVELSYYKNPQKTKSNTFKITYTGILYPLHKVKHFLDAFKKFLNTHQGEDILLSFVGINFKPNAHQTVIENFAKEYPQNIKIIDTVPFHEAVKYQIDATVLLRFMGGSQINGLIGGKTYEYAATRNPILVILNETNRETSFFPNSDVQLFAYDEAEIIFILENLYTRFKNGEEIKTCLTEKDIYLISREYQIDILATAMKEKMARV